VGQDLPQRLRHVEWPDGLSDQRRTWHASLQKLSLWPAGDIDDRQIRAPRSRLVRKIETAGTRAKVDVRDQGFEVMGPILKDGDSIPRGGGPDHPMTGISDLTFNGHGDESVVFDE